MTGGRRRGSRLAALGLLALALAALWFGAARPLLAWRAASLETAQTAAAQIARFNAALRDAGPDGPTAPPDALLVADSAVLAGAALQQRVDAAIRQAGGRRLTARTEDPAADGAATRIRVAVDAEMDAQSLLRFLHAVETGAPMLFVDRLEISAPTDAALTPAEAPTPLRVSATVSAYMRAADDAL